MVALCGGVVGVAAGLGYAWLMIEGLRTWWLAAVTTPFLKFYVTIESLAIGFAVGLLVSLATIAWSLRQQRRVSVRRLLAGEATPPVELGRRRANWARIGGVIAIILAIALAASLGGQTSGEEQAGVFMSSGFLVLLAGLALIWDQLRSDRGATRLASGGSLVRLAIRNGARHPLRSTLTIGLMAAASFLIVSISAFRLEPPSQAAALAQRRRRFRADRPNRFADLPRSRHPSRARGVAFRFRGGQAAGDNPDHRAADSSRRRCKLPESLSAAAAAHPGRSPRARQARRLRLVRHGGHDSSPSATIPGCCSTRRAKTTPATP